MFLCPQRPGHILGAVHDTAALVVEAEDRGDHIGPAFRCFQGRRYLLLIANAASRWCCPRAKARGNEGLLFHSRLGLDRACHIVEVTHLITLIGGKGHRFSGDKGLHLHIAGRHQRPGNAMQVDAFIPLVDVVCFHLPRPRS